MINLHPALSIEVTRLLNFCGRCCYKAKVIFMLTFAGMLGKCYQLEKANKLYRQVASIKQDLHTLQSQTDRLKSALQVYNNNTLNLTIKQSY